MNFIKNMKIRIKLLSAFAIMVVFMGVIVALLLLSIYLPLFGVLGKAGV